MTEPNPPFTSVPRPDADAVIYRVAVAAFTYYPTRHLHESGYRLEEDIDWCLEPIQSAVSGSRSAWETAVREMIINPASDRQAFIRSLPR